MRDERRAEQREQAEMSLQILEALVRATTQRAELIEVVGRSEEVDDAELAVRELLGVGRIPAKAVLDGQLRWFTSRERAKLAARRDELLIEIAELE